MDSADKGMAAAVGFFLDWRVFRFGLSSLGSMVVDKTVFSLLCVPLEKPAGRCAAIALSLAAARAVSGNCNFYCNMKFVFGRPFTLRSYAGYWTLAAFHAGLSVAATAAASAAIDAHGLLITLVNFCADAALFLFSFIVQKMVVFGRKPNG